MTTGLETVVLHNAAYTSVMIELDSSSAQTLAEITTPYNKH